MSNEDKPRPWIPPWMIYRIRRPNEEVFEILWRDDGDEVESHTYGDGVKSHTYVATARQNDNARLIAAAPELLSAARRLLDYFDSPDDHPDCIKADVLTHLREVVEGATNPIAWKKEEA
tara:strand:+ start:426 stop:782 length:357 start_codon:yes stop_codon:yes gene_type:complete